MISIRKKIINAAVKCQIARDAYNADHTAKNLNVWNKASNKALNLLGNSFKYNNSNILTESNTENKITMGNGWTIEQTAASLTIRRNGVVKGTFNA